MLISGTRKRMFGFACLFAACFLVDSQPAWSRGEKEEVQPDYTKGDERIDSGMWALGSTGAFGWVYKADARQILVSEVAAGSPAAGKLMEHDVILGVVSPTTGQDTGSGKFTMEARHSLAVAIEEAEKQENGGKLVLNVWRAEKQLSLITHTGNETPEAPKKDLPADGSVPNVPLTGSVVPITLQLEVMGTYSPTSPWECKKTSAIIDKTAQAIVEKGLIRQRGNAKDEQNDDLGSIDRNLDALGLLATGEKKYLPIVRDYVRKVAHSSAERDMLNSGDNTWIGAYRNVLLCEYYLATGDDEVLPGLRTQSVILARGVSGVGTWSHGTADWKQNGLYGPPGAYGAMNQASMVCALSLVLAQKCELNEPFVDEAVSRALDFLRYYVDKGCVPYGDHPPAPYHDNNGRMSIGAVLFDLTGQKKEAEYFARMTLASYNMREIGHTGHFFAWQWGALGAARGGQEAAQFFTRNTRWFTELERRFDGSAEYQPQLRKDSHKYTNWSAAGSRLMQYCLPRKALYITGKGGSCVTPITGNQMKDVVDSGTFDPEGLAEDDLLKALGSWSLLVRQKAAEELGTRDKDVVNELIAMLDSPNRFARYGACLALSYAGRQSSDAVDALMKRIETDEDTTFRYFAVNALKSDSGNRNGLGDAVSKALPWLLKLAANPDLEQDKTNKMGQQIADVLFYGGRGQLGGYFPGGKGLDSVDRALLIPALKEIFKNPNGAARSMATRVFPYLTEEDIEQLWGEIYYMAANQPPSGVMFSGASVERSRKMLADYKFEEGIPLAVEGIRPGWGAFARIPASVEALSCYGSAVKPYLPQIQPMIERFIAGRNPKDATRCKLAWDTVMENIDKEVELKSIKPYLQKTAKPLKVFIMAGQSNMQGKARVKTIERLNMTEDSKEMYNDMTEDDGTPVTVEGVHVAYFTSNLRGNVEQVGPLNPGLREARDFSPGDPIGPEYTFGIYLQKHLNEPFLIIKIAWGGTGLLKHWRPPHADVGEGETGPSYSAMMTDIQKVLAEPGKYHPAYDKDAGYEIAGFVWFQAWNDLVNGFYRDDYEKNQTKEGEYLYAPYARLMASFIRDVRKDLGVPAMPFVIGVVGVNGSIDNPKEDQYWLRKAQEAPAAMPEFAGTVKAVRTESFWDTEWERINTKLHVAMNRILDEQKYRGGPRARSEKFRTMQDDVGPKELTTEEYKLYKAGSSNAPFHYLGSAYIHGKIGKAFADAMAQLLGVNDGK